MKNNSLLNYIGKVFFIVGFMTFSSSCLNAWTIQILDPQETNPNSNLLIRSSFSTFENYMKNTGAILSATSGSLEDYNINDSDAVIVNLHSGNGSIYSDAELSVLNSLLHSNTRVLVFGEYSPVFDASNQQLANLLGGIYNFGGYDYQSVISNAFPIITGGVDNVEFYYVSKISPNGLNGHSLLSDDGVTLWGANDNFLLFMDNDALADQIANADNNKFAHNIANWLSGIDITVPEPSSYALFFGMALLGNVALKRRRKIRH